MGRVFELGNEMHERLGGKRSLLLDGWPAFDPALAEEETVAFAVQVNGKLRGQLVFRRDAPEEELVAAALADDAIGRWVAGKERVKTVFVPGRLLNLVVR